MSITIGIYIAFVIVYLLGIATGVITSKPDKPVPRDCSTCKHAVNSQIDYICPECAKCITDYPGAGYDRMV